MFTYHRTLCKKLMWGDSHLTVKVKSLNASAIKCRKISLYFMSRPRFTEGKRFHQNLKFSLSKDAIRKWRDKSQSERKCSQNLSDKNTYPEYRNSFCVIHLNNVLYQYLFMSI
jgi:hypothetical protein